MEVRQAVNKRDFCSYDTERIRKEFLIEKVFIEDEITGVYSHIDRIITGGVFPVTKDVNLINGDAFHAKYFLERREMGVINIGGAGIINADGKVYKLNKLECLYIGRGTQNVIFGSVDAANPAKFYYNSTPAHTVYPTTLIDINAAVKVDCGSMAECNERTIYKYILPQVLPSCQLVMGLTILKKGSVWNTMPAHTHERRMEVYLYFDIKPDNLVFHFMGAPEETRHIVVNNEQAVISPSFSIHSGCGTNNYTFIWGMCGENQDFDDMDNVKTEDMR